MKYIVKLSTQANEDIKEIYEYIANILCEKEIASNTVSLFEKNILSLSEMPGRCRIYESEPWQSRGVHVMSVKNYLIFYVINEEEKTVNILRILYGSRDIDNVL